MSEPDDEESQSVSNLPRRSDGFHSPDEQTRRRNRITVAIILLFLLGWLLLGFRQAFFGS